MLAGSLAALLFFLAKPADASHDASTHGFCSNGCSAYKRNGRCEDGGPGSLTDDCEYGTDCTDCYTRYLPPSPLPPPSPSPSPWLPPPPPRPPPPVEFQMWMLALVPVILLIPLLIWFVMRWPKIVAQRNAVLYEIRTKQHEQWAAAGVGDRFVERHPNFVAPPVVQAQAVPLPAGPTALWQSLESGGLGCELFPQLIEAGVHQLCHISHESVSRMPPALCHTTHASPTGPEPHPCRLSHRAAPLTEPLIGSVTASLRATRFARLTSSGSASPISRAPERITVSAPGRTWARMSPIGRATTDWCRRSSLLACSRHRTRGRP